MAKNLAAELEEQVDEITSSLDQIEDVEDVAKKINKLNAEQKKAFLYLAKTAITETKSNIKQLNKLLKVTSEYVKEVDSLVKNIVKS